MVWKNSLLATEWQLLLASAKDSRLGRCESPTYSQIRARISTGILSRDEVGIVKRWEGEDIKANFAKEGPKMDLNSYDESAIPPPATCLNPAPSLHAPAPGGEHCWVGPGPMLRDALPLALTNATPIGIQLQPTLTYLMFHCSPMPVPLL
jgi:hypothetical protein